MDSAQHEQRYRSRSCEPMHDADTQRTYQAQGTDRLMSAREEMDVQMRVAMSIVRMLVRMKQPVALPSLLHVGETVEESMANTA